MPQKLLYLGDVLWIDPHVMVLPDCPDGFALRIIAFHGHTELRVHVEGVRLHPYTSEDLDRHIVVVPIDQPHARRVWIGPDHRLPRSPAPVEPPAGVMRTALQPPAGYVRRMPA